jgi:peroxin-12
MALLKSTFKAIYPYSNIAYELYLLSYNIRYLFDKTPYWRPWLSWMNVEVRRMSADDYRAAQATTASLLLSPLRRHSPSGLPPTIMTILGRSIQLIPLLSFEALKFLLPTSIFFFRFLEWWYSAEGGYARLRKKGSGAGAAQALRAPPSRESNDEADVAGMKKGGICVVHKGVMVNPTALPSGYLGCYKCLFSYVEANCACPITKQVISVVDLRKIVG